MSDLLRQLDTAVLYDGAGYESVLPELAAARIRELETQLAEARAEGWRKGIEAAAQAADDWFYDPENDAVTDTRLSAAIRALPMPAFGELPDMTARARILTLQMPADPGAPFLSARFDAARPDNRPDWRATSTKTEDGYNG